MARHDPAEHMMESTGSGEEIDGDHPLAPVDGVEPEPAPPVPPSPEAQMEAAARSIVWTHPKS